MLSINSFIFFMVGWTIIVIVAVLATVMRIVRQQAKADRLPIVDPGPLDDAGLRRALRDPRLGPASPLLDRVQSAFERLLRERDEARRRS